MWLLPSLAIVVLCFLNRATTADSRRGESHRLTLSIIATDILRGEPPRFVEESHRDSSRIVTKIRRGEPPILDEGRATDSLRRGEPPMLRNRPEPPARFFVEANSACLRGREKELMFSFPPKIAYPIPIKHTSLKRRFFPILIKTRLLR
ncbi:hypothetical protein DY000_02023261 [Brassica cretica]|uniref:Secreted protein n=1 Tax=Brassica cretica TaxID=69181 RepID=A0ABQ7E6Y2_BRACR|nr:hypothetical protein DY000_02023261 [Brassica cretica]